MTQPKPRPEVAARVAPLVPAALAAAAGVAADRYGGPCGTAAWAGLGALFGLLAVAAGRREWLGRGALLAALLALAGGWNHYRWSDLAADDLARSAGDAPRPAWVRGVLSDRDEFRAGENARDSGFTRGVVELRAAMTAGGWRRASGRALLTVSGDRSDLRPGDSVELAGGLALIARPLNPGEFDARSYRRGQGVRLRIDVDDPQGVWEGGDSRRPRGVRDSALAAWWRWRGRVRAWARERLGAGLGPSTSALAAALLLGRRDGVDAEVNDAFARTGTTHLLAVSGLHMQVLAVVFGQTLAGLGFGRRRSLLAVGLATAAYAGLVGFMPSVVRSAAVTLTYCAAGLLDRCHRPANTLAVAALVTLLMNPADLFDAGCQLSFLGVASLVWVAGPAAARVACGRPADPLVALDRYYEPGPVRALRRAWGWALRGLLTSTAVWLVGAPLVALRFHLVSPVGVALNLPLIPMTSAALMASGLSLGLSAVWGPLGRPASWLAGVLLRGTEGLVRWGGSLRWGHLFVAGPSAWWVLGVYGLLGLATAAGVGRWRGRRWAWGALAGWSALGLWLAAGLGVRPDLDAPPRAEVLAVGHGSAVLIEGGAGHAVLYDCGRLRDPSVGRRVVAPALWARGLSRLDAVVLSHADYDHYGGLPDLLDRVAVGEVLVPEGFAGPANPEAARLLDLVRARGVAVREVTSATAWALGATRLVVRHPPPGWRPWAGDNARSVALDVLWRGRRLALTGDLEGPGLLAYAEAAAGPVDVFLAPHHGGRTANPPWLYDKVRPALVVVSQRPPQPGAHDPLSVVEARKTPVDRTWRRGAVRLLWSPEGITAHGFLDE